MRVWAIVVAAGRGDRFGKPKQFEDVGGRRLVDRAVDAARAAGAEVVVVGPPDAALAVDGCVRIVAGGSSRSESVRNGLGAVPDDADVVVVHDAARPLAPIDVFARVIAAVAEGADAAVPVLPVADTVKEVEDGMVVRTFDRTRLVAVQTPQAFRASALRRAHAGGGQATDDAALVEAGGGRVVVVPGDPRALKVTTPADLVVVRALLDADG